LLRISDDEEPRELPAEDVHDALLDPISVLELVDEQIPIPAHQFLRDQFLRVRRGPGILAANVSSRARVVAGGGPFSGGDAALSLLHTDPATRGGSRCD
jgi:hypothetical protein